MQEQNSDERSGTEEDSDNAVNTAAGGGGGMTAAVASDAASINDYNGYENIFRPRRREGAILR